MADENQPLSPSNDDREHAKKHMLKPRLYADVKTVSDIIPSAPYSELNVEPPVMVTEEENKTTSPMTTAEIINDIHVAQAANTEGQV